MDPAVLGVVLDASVVITAERQRLPVREWLDAIRATHGDLELSLSPVTIAELVHGIFRARTPEITERRRAYISELVDLIPTHPMTAATAYLVGEIDATETLKGNVLPLSDLLIAAAALEQGYAVLTENRQHFERIPGVRVLTL
jgi:tRNA(fMet)-specific endonuclease VapC